MFSPIDQLNRYTCIHVWICLLYARLFLVFGLMIDILIVTYNIVIFYMRPLIKKVLHINNSVRPKHPNYSNTMHNNDHKSERSWVIHLIK